ncbi:MAG: hypothetical protein M1548_08065 [Actinobacteria bacterium]|nr:hypothetical protein [Actinomycetota bacterium]
MGESLEERHLGLVPIAERASGLELAIENISYEINRCLDIERLLEIAGHPTAGELGSVGEPVAHYSTDGESQTIGHMLSTRNSKLPEKDGKVPVIGVACDEAFNFYYTENLDLLAERARLIEFSPLNDPLPPEADGFYFGGGFPEVFAGRLAANEGMREGLRQAIAKGAPTYAECGGLIYMGKELEDFDGRKYPMVAAVDISCKMRDKLTLGYREVEAVADTPLFAKGTLLRGHEFHRSKITRCGEDARAYRDVDSGVFEGIAKGNILATYIHLHFYGEGDAAGRLVTACRERSASRHGVIGGQKHLFAK